MFVRISFLLEMITFHRRQQQLFNSLLFEKFIVTWPAYREESLCDFLILKFVFKVVGLIFFNCKVKSR